MQRLRNTVLAPRVTCLPDVCRSMAIVQVFKREMNLIFHMTTHRPRQPQTESSEPTSTQPVKCQDCNKEFATKYQAKKHYLRRHFAGEKPFACTKCNKKRFVVKEDLTMHMKVPSPP
jgi:DNA-directed RNA polymerase subunit RPC12/RpoP